MLTLTIPEQFCMICFLLFMQGGRENKLRLSTLYATFSNNKAGASSPSVLTYVDIEWMFFCLMNVC